MPDLLPYGRHWIDDDDVDAVVRVLRGDWLTTGPAVPAFERALAAASGAAFAVAVSSGTAALHAAYAAIGLGRGDEVVTSPLTFAATATAALHLGARVRFADVEPDTGNLDPAAVEAARSPSTRAIVPVDFAGHPADYARLGPLASRSGLALVADAAHSLGARADGRPIGHLAPVAVTSFHPVKAITTGEGGAVLARDPDLAERARRFRNHGIQREPERFARPADGPWAYEVQALGLNYRMPDLLAALGASQLAKLDRFLARRRDLASRYLAALADVPGIELPPVREGVEPSWHLFAVRVVEARRRRAFFDALRARGLGVQVHYAPVHLHPLFRDLGHREGECPVAEDLSARLVSLPLFPRLRDDEVERVIEATRAAAREAL